jgi:hypothetical protein
MLSMPASRILITNCWLADRAGTELYVRDLALALQRAGRQPVVFSPILGEVAAELRQAGVPVTDDLAAPMATPDVIHGHHGFETLAALSRFPGTPGIYVQHDAAAWQDEPPHHPRLLRHLAVDELCRERLVAAGADPARTEVVPNAVDLGRFAQRGPLPAVPRRALVLTNSPGESFVPVIAQACAARGIELDVLGKAVGQPVLPEDVLAGYDVVFAKARTALEAMAVGCAVVVCDQRGVAGLVTAQDVAEWRRWNFGRRLLTQRYDAGLLAAELARYDAQDALRCTELVREQCGLDGLVARLTAVYDDVVGEFAACRPDHAAELVALAPQLARLGPLHLAGDRYDAQSVHVRNLGAQISALEAERTAAQEHVQSLEASLQAERAEAQARDAAAAARLEQERAEGTRLGAELAQERAEGTRLGAELVQERADREALEATLTFRTRAGLLRSRAGRALVRTLRRRART